MIVSSKILRLAAAAAVLATVYTVPSDAAVTNDREYWFGEDDLENASQGAQIGSDNTPPLADDNSADSKGPTGAFLDLTQFGGPTYQDVGPGGLARPGAAAGDFGARFDGVDDRLKGIPLNRPDELKALVDAGGPSTPFPLNYTGITVRGLQAWVYPDAAAIGTPESPTTFQSIVFDTIFSGGPAINAQGQWTQINSFHGDGANGIAPVPASVPATGDVWHHVMHHNYDATALGGPQLVPGTGTARPFTSVLYVDGVAVSANNDNINTGGDGDFEGALVVGGAEIDTDNAGTTIEGFGNYFSGVVDDLEMYVYGDNTADGGMDWGQFDLFADNKWIAQKIADDVPGGVLTPGDVNKDGSVNGDGTGPATSDDVSAFIAGWGSVNAIQGNHSQYSVGDWNTWDNGDMNHDGLTDFADWFLLRANHPQGAALNLGELLAASVPEPTSLVALTLGLAGLGGLRRRG